MSRSTTTEYNLVVHLTRKNTRELPSAPAFAVEYEIGGEEFGGVTAIRLGVASQHGVCE